MFVSILTRTGSVYVIWPFDHEFGNKNRDRNHQLDQGAGAKVVAEDSVIPCNPIDIDAEPLALPDIPSDLPRLLPQTDQEPPKPKLVHIAAGDNFIIGLTDQGHVLSIDVSSETPFDTNFLWLRDAFVRKTRTWKYVSMYYFKM